MKRLDVMQFSSMILLCFKVFLCFLLSCMLLLSTASANSPHFKQQNASFLYKKNIHFATEATYPPFEYTNESGAIIGFDIDIAKALCGDLHVSCSFSNQPFSTLIQNLKMNKFDAIIASIGITPERKKQVNFSVSYYEPSASFVAARDKKTSISALTHGIIGVQQGSTFEQYLEDRYSNTVTIKSYYSVQDIFLDLISERIDAALVDTPIATAWIESMPEQDTKNNAFGIVDKAIIDHRYFGTGYGIAINKNNPLLLNALNHALNNIKKNGIYTRIFHHYFTKEAQDYA